MVPAAMLIAADGEEVELLFYSSDDSEDNSGDLEHQGVRGSSVPPVGHE
jgi:hypothetical protein